MQNLRFLMLSAFFLVLVSPFAKADEGHPVAIRRWSETGFTVETMWNLHVSVGVDDQTKKQLPRPVDAALEKLPGLAGWPASLYREPNQESVVLAEGVGENKPNLMSLVISKAYETKPHLDARPLSNTTEISVDGVSVQFLDHDRMKMETRMQRIARATKSRLRTDQYLVTVAVGDSFDAEFCEKYASSIKPDMMIVNSKLKQIGDMKVETVTHNTVAISKQKAATAKTRFVALGTTTYKMSDELTDLFKKKEQASKASQEVFAKLSIEQLNFKPANGTHTPRWNTEHMMGRELVFFSQIYHSVNKTIPVMDLNPKQMPKDYEFAHAEWTGKEEAMQTQRVQQFTRRFAYLLDGMDLDKKAPGSRFWTPRALLKQMHKHYGEHTANVVKKMKLEGWPGK